MSALVDGSGRTSFAACTSASIITAINSGWNLYHPAPPISFAIVPRADDISVAEIGDDESSELTFFHVVFGQALEAVAEQRMEAIPGMDPAWFSVDRAYRLC
jgi:hypothetical protein